MGIKISELDSVSNLQEGCCLPIVSNGETRKLSYGTLKNKLNNDLEFSKFSGEYEDLSGKPTKTSDFENDGDGTNQFLTQHQDISGKQDILISGENIKTINNQSLLGSGNIIIEGGTDEIEISPTTPTNNAKVWIKHNIKNVIPYNIEKILGGYAGDGSWVYPNTNYLTLRFIPVKPNKTYTFSGNFSSSKYSTVRVVSFTNNKTFISRDDGHATSNTITFTTNSTTYFVALCLYTAGTSALNDMTEYQLEEGTSVTSYEAPVVPSINVNNNGSYDEIYNSNIMNYLETEQIVGTWRGETLYKRIRTANLSSNSNTTSFSLPDACRVRKVEGTIYSDGVANILPMYNSASNYITPYQATPTAFSIVHSDNYKGKEFEIVLYYTKTTNTSNLLSMGNPNSEE